MMVDSCLDPKFRFTAIAMFVVDSCLDREPDSLLVLEKHRFSALYMYMEAAHFLRKSDCLGCAVLLCLVV